MKLLFICFIVLVNFFFSSCSSELKGSHSYTFYNNSAYAIGIYVALGGRHGTMYPDTSLPSSDNYVRIIGQGGMQGFSSRGSWEYIFDQLPKDTLSIFVLHGDTLAKYSWNEIREGTKILKRYDLSYLDLKNANFAIHYP